MMSSDNENVSEVARFRRQIALETEAMQRALQAPAMVGRHAIILHRYEAIGKIQDDLATLVGKEKAALVAAQTYIETMKDWQAPEAKPSLSDLLNAYNKDQPQKSLLSMAHLAHDANVERQVVYDLAQGKPVPRDLAARIVAAFNLRTKSCFTINNIAVLFSD